MFSTTCLIQNSLNSFHNHAFMDKNISVELESKSDVEHNISKAQNYLINLMGNL